MILASFACSQGGTSIHPGSIARLRHKCTLGTFRVCFYFHLIKYSVLLSSTPTRSPMLRLPPLPPFYFMTGQFDFLFFPIR